MTHGLVLYLRQQTQERTITGSCLASVDRLMEAAARLEQLEDALRSLMTAVTYAAPATPKFGDEAGPCYEARVPDEFVLRAMAALDDK